MAAPDPVPRPTPPVARRLPWKLGFALVALPLLARTVLRVALLDARHPLDVLTERLRRVRPFALATLRQPEDWRGLVERLLPLLPPFRYRACLRRSLLLLDLWSRCGCDVRLVLGWRPGTGEEQRFGHAWVETTGDGHQHRTPTLGYPSTFEL